MLLENGREIKHLDGTYIEEYLDVYLNAYPAYKELDDECREKYRQINLYNMANDPDVKFTGLFENGKLIATMKLVSFSINLFGKMSKACGIMALGVHPLHKKKGAALDMVRYFEHYTRETGAVVAILLPFNMRFYRNMGYGYGAKMDEYRIPAAGLPKASDLSKLVMLTPSDAPTVLECYNAHAKRTHGALMKFSEEARDLLEDTQVRRIGYLEDGKLKGYVAYRVVSDSEVNYTVTRAEVSELIYDDGCVLKALLGFLRNQADLAQTVAIRTGEPDFYHVLDDAQDVSKNYMDFGYLQTNVSAVGTMYKILSPEKFIEETTERKFPAIELTVGFSYEDELAHCSREVAVSFVKSADGVSSCWKVADADASCDVTVSCRKADLSSLFMGALEFGSMVRMGMAEISDSSMTDELDRLFHVAQKPFSNTDY